ncbi:LLM class flavin-dependent oxidoreductase [Actinomadura rugatobispora]|uniref:LLM class flavin-dependent oxidoreductase n=1 Tax=Actinomadura rugatobispora TaxID=1994 RepID=A0ABW0ZY47_9ACTN|nr:LLM class flavin-dependent oxidoreductase [Actinomadura rugatobispora]
MRFGVQYLFRRPAGDERSMARVYAQELEQIRFAEQLGFDDVWVGEHHFVEDGWLPSPLAAAAAIAAVTSRVEIGTNAAIPALHHPIRLAEDCAVVDAISGGRLLLGAALGYRAREFDTLGVPHRQRAGRLEETVEILRRCWTEESFSFSGRYFAFEDVRCRPRPDRAAIPVWIAAAEAERSLRRVARIGDGWLASGAPQWHARKTYLAALDELGKPVDRPPIAASSKPWLFATRDPERDRVWLRPLARAMMATAQAWYDEAGQQFPGGFTGEQLADRLLLVDTPENIVAEIRRAHAEGSFTRHIHQPILLGAPPDRAAEALELFAAEVLPHVRSLGEPAEEGE